MEMAMDRGGVAPEWKRRCVVVSPRHAFVRPWIRAYFASGNSIPLVIIPGPPGDWRDGDLEYCRAAAEWSGGMVLDCSGEWRDSARLKSRAVRDNVGWYTKKALLHAVATRLAPDSWAWIDDDAEVTGNLDECFLHAERAPGFVYAQFYHPSEIDRQHPERMYRSRIDPPPGKVCWNSLVFFHGEANGRLAEALGKDYQVEDDECVFGHLYTNDAVWGNGFCDFSMMGWQANCKLKEQIPANWRGKLLHYTSQKNHGEVKAMWAAKSELLPKAPFEASPVPVPVESADGPVDAVFVIGTGSRNGNEELRYALRNMDRNCRFVRDVYICGYCPPWVDRSVVKHLEWPDRFTHAKDANIVDKLRHACEQPGIASRILFCSDDQFQTRECSWDDFWPRYLRIYSPDDGWYAAKNRIWHTRLRNTLERESGRRRSQGLDEGAVAYFQPHMWMQIDRDRFIEYAKWCDYQHRDDTIIASGYFNFAGIEGRPDSDHVFLRRGCGSRIPAATHVAYHDASYPDAMAMLKAMFPERSRFELADTPDAPAASPSVSSASSVSSAPPAPEIPASAGHDPSPATQRELSNIREIIARVRDTPVWNGLLHEISRAEELRLFGVRGWRVVWGDIQRRWRTDTFNGADPAPVSSARSAEATRILEAYGSNPDPMGDVRSGTPGGAHEPDAVPANPRPASGAPVSAEARASLRRMVDGLRARKNLV